ncbi:hypothetical protein MM239_00660 [Belliella sp. DSM 111904]|uniref:Tetratricopeptide repeat-containing protein n=1 Tax=Belliella filtrata TaxID=2923435 RepID=A0ABS9UUP9_9BACT|nr:hypothetical protein [Belliella filtrata]MCH7407891.1 hypothetical protein [Belliella filtrata]
MKKVFLFTMCFSTMFLVEAAHPLKSFSFCAGGWDEDYNYYNLFVQETIDEPQYYPFLLSYESTYYHSNSENNLPVLNENIEDWQKYFSISYDQAFYLVFSSSREELKAKIDGKRVENEKLDFVDNRFVTKYRQALLYLAYSKYLEPYMAVKSSGHYYWGARPEHTVEKLDYQTVINVLERSWKAETDKDLKLRYGYQLVRFAHYNLKAIEAIDYFNKYVESLNYRPIMYYYALDQKGGAERSLGNYMQAINDFFQFFTHTKNRKDQAYTSIKVTADLDFENMLKAAKNTHEQNELYLLLGFKDFNNPIAAFEKIVKNDPNAPQAKVLMARAINQLERDFMPTTYYCPYDNANCWEGVEDLRIPLGVSANSVAFLNLTLEASLRQTKQTDVADTDFWNLTTAWLYFIKKNDMASKEHLSLVKNEKYLTQKSKLEMLLQLIEQPSISPEFEEILVNKFKIFDPDKVKKGFFYSPSTNDFIIDVLANRYYLQEDFAKAFLLQNSIRSIEYNPDLKLLEAIENLYYKKDKNSLEKHLIDYIVPNVYNQNTQKYEVDEYFDFPIYVAYVKGNTLLRRGEIQKAKDQFDNVPDDYTQFREYYNYQSHKYEALHSTVYNGYANVPASLFGYNRIECFECQEDMGLGNNHRMIETDYLEDFPFIKPLMNKRELTEVVLQLEKIAGKKGETAAKANYLLGNFFYNISTLGYYRHILAFDWSNGNSPKYHNYYSWGGHYKERVPNYPFYFKNYSFSVWYPDDFNLPLTYLKKALKLTKNEETQARILFAASKCEQGIFYSTQDDEELNGLDKLDYKARNDKLLDVKISRYRTYFKKLKEMEQTQFYEEVMSHCKYFEHYSMMFGG